MYTVFSFKNMYYMYGIIYFKKKLCFLVSQIMVDSFSSLIISFKYLFPSLNGFNGPHTSSPIWHVQWAVHILISQKIIQYYSFKLDIISVPAPKVLWIFQGKFHENFGPKNLIFLKLCHNIPDFCKKNNFKVYFQILTKMKILESTVYVISQQIFVKFLWH